MTDIAFFNYHGNGDTFTSREYIKQIISHFSFKEIACNITYYNKHSSYLLKDLNLKWKHIDTLEPEIKKLHRPFSGETLNPTFLKNTLYIDTWIARAWIVHKNQHGCNYVNLQSVWNYLFNFINDVYKTELELKSVIEYIPSIDWSVFNISIIDEFLKNQKRKKILICNGEAYSGQCRNYNGDMKNLIKSLCENFEDILFITTNKIDLNYNNLFNTSDIIKNQDKDLYEISYLSTFCDIIIGRNSGPFVYSINKNNINQKNKIFFSIQNQSIRENALYNIKTNCNYIVYNFTNENQLIKDVFSLVEDFL